MNNLYDQLQFRIMEELEQAKGVPLTSNEIAQRLHERTFHKELFDTVKWRVTTKCHALKDKGKLLLSDARDHNGHVTYVLPQRMIFPPANGAPPVNPVLTADVAEKIVAVEKPEPQVPKRPYTVGLSDAVIKLLDEAKRPLTTKEIDKAARVAGISGNIGSTLSNLRVRGKDVQVKRVKRSNGQLKNVYFTAKTGGALKPVKRSIGDSVVYKQAVAKPLETPTPKPSVFRPGRALPVERKQLNLEITVDKYEKITSAAKRFDVPIVQFCLEAIDFALAHSEESV
ncbi:MAG: hypothetical protein M3R04_08480 [bacterium]|nr:hypothetical protein [bacterium]